MGKENGKPQKSVTKPILFNTEMVMAILDGRKTVTRRVVKPQPEFAQIYEYKGETLYCGEERVWCFTNHVAPDCFCECDWLKQFAPYRPGDILYVRETWTYLGTDMENNPCFAYKAKSPHLQNNMYIKWRPSIHMPREAARIFLRVTDVRAERLQDITEEQAIAEGVRIGIGGEPFFSCKDAFIDVWNSTLKKDSNCTFMHNPWVWVIEFERCEKP